MYYLVAILTLFIVLFSTRWALAGHCDGIKYINITDARRSTAFDPRNSSTKIICDRNVIKDGSWYRFTSDVGGELATTPQKIYSCGTYHPIWMNGSHPTVEEGRANRTACMNTIHVPTHSCDASFTITVLNCTGYYIYKLRAPKACNEAYCAGWRKPNCSNVEPNEICPVNFPPYFMMTRTTFYAIKNTTLLVPIIAKDPEIQFFGYTVLAKSTIKEVKINYKKELEITTNKSGTIYVRIEDEFSNENTLRVNIIFTSCPCENNGECRWDQSTPRGITSPTFLGCTCVTPYIGQYCQSISDAICRTLPCFPGLKCTATQNGYMCENCPEMFEGDGETCKPKKNIVRVVVTAQLTITRGLEWKDELTNKSSLYYKETTNEITNEIKKVYALVEEFVYTLVLGYRKGSVVVDFELIFSKEIPKPLEALKADKHGRLGKLTVDQTKTKTKIKDKDQKNSEDNKILGLRETIFIVIIVIASLLVILIIVAAAICLRKRKVSVVMLICNETAGSSERPRTPLHNKVVHISCVENKAFDQNLHHNSKPPIP